MVMILIAYNCHLNEFELHLDLSSKGPGGATFLVVAKLKVSPIIAYS